MTPEDLGAFQAEVRRGSRAVGIVLIAIALGMTGACVWLEIWSIDLTPGDRCDKVGRGSGLFAGRVAALAVSDKVL